ncbi:mental retardation GTPase activating protein homolog 4-like [Pseudomyrmex gracilis]|uniref:mental retardation GTPase activating protein homolog 4-like n=1 Tax=Pseudomyrmex gracilis TaxID=219809 RepID=UPI00099575F8|nr:mental retardation GTPase activating protein homolog 4-like [Pseudomyrmex gracilis]
MSENKDDPREVLVLLNSLGFVGITAAQLKAFMKDLKIYRKIKEREKQQRKEEIKTKVINSQQALIKETLGHRKINSAVPSESSNSHDSEPLVKIRIRCLSDSHEEDAQTQKCFKTTAIKSSRKQQSQKKDSHISEPDRVNCERLNVGPSDNLQSRQTVSKNVVKSSHATETEGIKPIQEHPTDKPSSSRPRLKSTTSDPTGHTRTQSALSATSSVNSKHKSFIRPWRLQPEVQRNINKKCDPVALYQKYQREWKQISFPGEAKHSKIRWAVREKMLGGDLLPVPLPRKSVSMPILKKK